MKLRITADEMMTLNESEKKFKKKISKYELSCYANIEGAIMRS